MAKKTSSTSNTASKKTETSVASQEPSKLKTEITTSVDSKALKQAKASPKKRAPVKKEPVQAPAPAVAEELEEELEEETLAAHPTVECTSFTTVQASHKSKRTLPTKESMITLIEEMISRGDKELEFTKVNTADKGAKEMAKLLKDDLKSLKTLKSHMSRVLTKKLPASRNTNVTSGLQKPVKLSKEMAKFIGCNPDERKTRIEVTKDVCKYIKDNDLQNPEDRRQIVPDETLRNLLRYDPKTNSGDTKLTYSRLQTYLKPHFISSAVAATAPAAARV